MPLAWSLVVATLNREEMLLRSLRANVHQTRAPRQVVVVDASDDWERVRARVFAEIVPETPGVEWTYITSDRRSLTRQRNLGLAKCSSEVVFLLDDDSFMYHDCAEEIMGVYERDSEREIAGVSAWLAGAPEGATTASSAEPSPSRGGALRKALVELVQRQWGQDRLFLPYDGPFRAKRARAIGERDTPVALFHGCRMTFRTDAVRAAGGFEEMLVGTAYGEDCDFSYRVSRVGALVEARGAILHHEQTPVARPKRELNTALVILNAIALYKLNADGRRGSPAWTAYAFLAKRGVLELLRDCARPRRKMPHTRGVLVAARLAPRVLALEGDALRQEYVAIQARARELASSGRPAT